MKYRIQITSTNPKAIIRTKDRLYDKKDYYDLATINCNRLPDVFEKLVVGEKLSDQEKENFKFLFYDVYERRNDCWHYLAIFENGIRKPVYSISFGIK